MPKKEFERIFHPDQIGAAIQAEEAGADVAMLDVTVVIAVSEDGLVLASVQDDCRLAQKAQHEAWLRQICESKRLWTLKTIKTRVPLPVQYEDQV